MSAIEVYALLSTSAFMSWLAWYFTRAYYKKRLGQEAEWVRCDHPCPEYEQH